MKGHDNPVFRSEDFVVNTPESVESIESVEEVTKDDQTPLTEDRDNWSSSLEFLFSCIALSVGLGNIWRFPYVAMENGGGAFVIPYIICLLLIGKATYFMEMAMGQFSSRNSVKVFDCVPALRGIGMAQVIATSYVTTYYASTMAITLSYLIDSFKPTLPWSYCREEWGPCIPSSGAPDVTWTNESRSSAELYFLNEVIRARPNILDGIGMPIWSLIGYLALSWAIVFVIGLRGVRSIGKASYVLAIFPYVVLLILLVRALTLPGAFNGIAYLFTPQWDKILDPTVWFAAVTQVFFSLSIFFGVIVVYGSYNKFDHKVYRDANIVTTLDTFTALLAGSVIFGIIGHLAHELGVEDISLVVHNGPGLAFISYPDAISKFNTLPQVFGVLFFLMLFLLGLGSLVAMVTCATTLIRDRFKSVTSWQASLGFSIFGFLAGTIYVTEGGQSVLGIVDFYGANFIIFILAIGQLYAFCYIYGVKRVCQDIKFMLGFTPNLFWRACWWVITPGLMTILVIYVLIYLELPRDGNYEYPFTAHAIGWCLTFIAMIQLPIFAIHKIYHRKDATLWGKIKSSFRPTEHWGPKNPDLNKKYKEMLGKSD